MDLSEQKQSKKLEGSRVICKNCSTREDLYCGSGKPVMTAFYIRYPITLRMNGWTKKLWKMSDLPKYLGWNAIVTLMPSDH